ncbi:hypothetical protein RSAG8_04203, partial [Rhizoctonia solani AG-8 WAC10335]
MLTSIGVIVPAPRRPSRLTRERNHVETYLPLEYSNGIARACPLCRLTSAPVNDGQTRVNNMRVMCRSTPAMWFHVDGRITLTSKVRLPFYPPQFRPEPSGRSRSAWKFWTRISLVPDELGCAVGDKLHVLSLAYDT